MTRSLTRGLRPMSRIQSWLRDVLAGHGPRQSVITTRRGCNIVLLRCTCCCGDARSCRTSRGPLGTNACGDRETRAPSGRWLGCGPSRPKRFAHHRPGGLPPCYFAEPGPVVHGLCAEEHVIRMTSFVVVDRICLQKAGAVRACMVHGCPQHALGKTSATRSSVDEEAHDGPHRSIVHRLHDRAPTELRIVLSWPERDPCDRNALLVSDEPRYGSLLHEGLHRLPVVRAYASPRSGLSVEHAEAGSNDGPIEQLDQVVPPLLCYGAHIECHPGQCTRRRPAVGTASNLTRGLLTQAEAYCRRSGACWANTGNGGWWSAT
jgi:hypothetical protein